MVNGGAPAALGRAESGAAASTSGSAGAGAKACVDAAAARGRLLRVWTLTDIHADYAENEEWVRALCARGGFRGDAHVDVLLCCGDVSDDLRLLRKTLGRLAAAFAHVFFVPGNHELWLRGDPATNGGCSDSVCKLMAVIDLCEELGVHATPKRFGRTAIVPLLSWHHARWDEERDVPGMPLPGGAATDYSACVWPDHIPGSKELGADALARWFDGLNEGLHDGLGGGPGTAGAPPRCDVISMSHFLPLQALLPEKRYLTMPNVLPKLSGSTFLARRLALLAPRPRIHVFGHHHFSWDLTVAGMRYVSAPLCYPSERRRRLRSLKFADAVPPLSPASAPAPAEEGAASAPWLPVLLYAAWLAPDELAPRDDVTGGGIRRLRANIARATAALPLPRRSPGAASRPGAAPSPSTPAAPSGTAADAADAADSASESGAGGALESGAEAAARNAFPAGAGVRLPQGGYMSPPLAAAWSEYYAEHERRPNDVELAPWVAHLYRRRLRRRVRAGKAREVQQ